MLLNKFPAARILSSNLFVNELMFASMPSQGHETKAMKNNSGPRYKSSQLERRLNQDVLWCVFLLLAMCLTAAIGWYLHWDI